MRPHCGCQRQARAGGNNRPVSRWRRGREIAAWLLPSATLALLPKCPACVAAYVALATGIGISLPTAAYLRTSLGVACMAALIFMVVRRWRSVFLHRMSQR